MPKKIDFVQIAATKQFAWRNAPDGDRGPYVKWLLCISESDVPLIIAGMYGEHKLIPVPKGYQVIGAGDLDHGGYVGDWGSHGLQLETPHELRESFEAFFQENLAFIQSKWFD